MKERKVYPHICRKHYGYVPVKLIGGQLKAPYILQGIFPVVILFVSLGIQQPLFYLMFAFVIPTRSSTSFIFMTTPPSLMGTYCNASRVPDPILKDKVG